MDNEKLVKCSKCGAEQLATNVVCKYPMCEAVLPQPKKPDCFIEQYENKVLGRYERFVWHNEKQAVCPFTVALTKVYLKDSYKKELVNEFQYSY